MHTERGNALIIIIGIILLLFIVGFFRSDDHSILGDFHFNFKSALRLPCGITVDDPRFGKDEKIVFPLKVDGYVNGCGWDVANGSAGTVQVFDGKGLPVTAPVALSVPEDSKDAPFYFETVLVPTAPPHTDTGNMLIRSTTGLLRAIPVIF